MRQLKIIGSFDYDSLTQVKEIVEDNNKNSEENDRFAIALMIMIRDHIIEEKLEDTKFIGKFYRSEYPPNRLGILPAIPTEDIIHYCEQFDRVIENDFISDYFNTIKSGKYSELANVVLN